jgi:hypothetical protein
VPWELVKEGRRKAKARKSTEEEEGTRGIWARKNYGNAEQK